MTRVVVVHGVGQQFLGKGVLHSAIGLAVLDGLDNAGLETSGLTPADVSVAFYGRVFRQPGTKDLSDLPLIEEIEDDFETALLRVWWEGGALQEPDRIESPERSGSKAPVPRSVQHMMEALTRSRSMTKIAQRFLLGSLRQVNRYLNETGIRERAQECVSGAVGADTRVLVGHSLGSVVAYEALCAHPQWPVTTFVTLGSPLGIRNLIFDRLRPPPVAGRGEWPGGVASWTNLCDVNDVVALVKKLGPQFDPPGGWRRVKDKTLDNGWKVHDLIHHLTDSDTGRAVAAGLRL
ncbi:alpha/beta hydrolase family protein [Streptomyces phaeochromogenes]|uniref:hypothetical protein n=1 Tax=Streptomyces phaeochromogenes TaxID=1923 RepID=UPI00371D14D1